MIPFILYIDGRAARWAGVRLPFISRYSHLAEVLAAKSGIDDSAKRREIVI